ncbi:MAG: 23S rRNA (uracil(1939)-C(5))-methyltransferase RlmD [Williamsia sp.]|nr:23S rRNA (uracil(1939)-C(5))-methyltransferase RlmD [Williamsia sp.]
MRKKQPVLHQVAVQDYAAEGKSLGRQDGKVVFIEGAVPGDLVDVQLSKNKKDWAAGKAIRFHAYAQDRVEPFCEHFGVCGGCKWQMLPYEKQLQYKAEEVEQNLRRIGKVELPLLAPILGAKPSVRYRNKLEFTFSNRRYLRAEEISSDRIIPQQDALGFHAPGIFDKAIDIYTCHLMQEPVNKIRNTVRDFALEHRYPFYDIKAHTGWLRTLIVRICTTGEIMVNMVVAYEDKEETARLLDHLLVQVPSITSLLYTINPKWNDSIYDLQPQVYKGRGYIVEQMEDFRFKISPKSFFQTNTYQAENLYRTVREFAALTGRETVYDLYCGTGSIGIFLSKGAARIVGVEMVEDAVQDARENALLNSIGHAQFFAGDVASLCTPGFFAEHGQPDVIITDPPRAGMDEKLVRKILDMAAPRVVYVSCNAATQARDLALLDEKYAVTRVQPVDMFPHTHHIENVVQLTIR